MGSHPIVQFIFYGVVLVIAMFYRHPILLGLSLLAAVVYAVRLAGWKGMRYGLLLVPVCLLSAAVNPLFSHRGETILGHFPNGAPITLEAVLYGAVSGLMLAVVLLWFYSLHEVMTSDKWLYLSGRLLPTVSLLLAMVFGLIPKYRRQIKRISDAQRGIGKDIGNGTIKERLSHGMGIMSIMATWALEHSVETADSMRSRGYGLHGRTSYVIYRFDSRDFAMLLVEFAGIAGFVAGVLTGRLQIEYYPVFSMGSQNAATIVLYMCYGVFCFLPVVVDLVEDMQWHYIQSKI